MAFNGSKFIEDDYLNIGRNLVKGTSFVHVLGAVPTMSINTTGSIWDVGDTSYPWTAFNTASVLNIPAVNVGDNGRTVTIFGLDSNYDPISETLTLSSAGTTTGEVLFKRVNSALLFDTVQNLAAAGNINIRVGTTTVARIRLGGNRTLMANYTVPNGYNAYLTQGVMTCQSGADATGFFYIKRQSDTHFRIGHTFEVQGGAEYLYKFTCPYYAPHKTDIDVRASVRSNNARLTAAYDIILIRREDDRGNR